MHFPIAIESRNCSDTPSTSKSNVATPGSTPSPSSSATSAAVAGVKRKKAECFEDESYSNKAKKKRIRQLTKETLSATTDDHDESDITPKRHSVALHNSDFRTKLFSSEDIVVKLNSTLSDIANRMDKWESKMKSMESSIKSFQAGDT